MDGLRRILLIIVLLKLTVFEVEGGCCVNSAICRFLLEAHAAARAVPEHLTGTCLGEIDRCRSARQRGFLRVSHQSHMASRRWVVEETVYDLLRSR